MKKLFIHHPLFRLLSPVFSGIVVYLIVLLVNNDVEQLQDTFLGKELYVCIGLSYIIQEFSRGLLMLFQKFANAHTIKILVFQIIVSMGLCIVLTSFSISMYYKQFLGFSITGEMLWLFNIIFCCITLIYILLHLSHQYLYKINTQKLSNELLLKQSIEDDFVQFKKGINTNLLFESLESLIVLIKQNKDKTDHFIDQLATVYRYILSKRNQQLVGINEELEVLNHLIELFNYLPYRNIRLTRTLKSNFLVPPGSLLTIVEHIIRCTINAVNYPLEIEINDIDDLLILHYRFNDKIVNEFKVNHLKDVVKVYRIYSNIAIKIQDDEQFRTISIPKLIIKQ